MPSRDSFLTQYDELRSYIEQEGSRQMAGAETDLDLVGATPILPAHIEDTVRAIAKLHADHDRQATSLERWVERLTTFFAQPRFVGLLTLAVALWIGANLLCQPLGYPAVDPPPFNWLQGLLALAAVYMTSMILTTQRRAGSLASHREQLTLELAILSEQKNAKIIELLEEMRRDNPLLKDRDDPEADDMSKPADPEAVLTAIQETHEVLLAEEAGDVAQENSPGVVAGS